MTVQANWTNWAHNINCKATIITPKNKQELVALIKQAHKEHKTMRAYGSGHSWSNIVCPDNGYIINTEKLNKVLSIDKEKNQVTVQAGIKLKDLNSYLAQHNLALSNQAAITEQSLAGAVSTATHGSGKTGTLASFITSVELLTADGKFITSSRTKNKKLFECVRTSIGSLGIMTELTVQCEPLFKVAFETKTFTWPDFLQNYKQLLTQNDYVQFYWFAENDTVQAVIHNRVENNQKGENVNYSYTLASNPSRFYMEEEIAVPRAHFVKAAQAVGKLLQQEAKKNALFNGVLFRFVSAETDNILSPASDTDVVYFSITTGHKSGYEKLFKKFYELMLKYQGRPHWGKINYLTHQDAVKLYGNNLDKFITIRKKLDPHGLFSNEFTKSIFGW